MAAKQVTSLVPIVFALGDPTGTGLVATLARPAGNVTGLSTQTTDIASKRLEVLREAAPKLRRLAILANVSNSASALEMQAVDAAARKLDIEVIELKIRQADEIAPAFASIEGRADAIYVPPDSLLNANRIQINSLALGARLPTMLGSRDYVAAGGFISYGPNYPDLFRRTAEYVDKILRGANPAELPVEQPTKFELVVNLKTAKALGVEIPPTMLSLADEVIE